MESDMCSPTRRKANHQDQQEAYNLGWNAGRWNEPRNSPYFDRPRRREYVEGYNDGKRYRAAITVKPEHTKCH